MISYNTIERKKPRRLRPCTLCEITMKNLRLQIIENAKNWNNTSRTGRNKQAVISMTAEQIDKLKKVNLKDIEKSGLKFEFGTGSNSFDLDRIDEGIVGVPTPTSPALRFLTCRESSKLEKEDPRKNTQKRMKNKAGPLAAMWIVNNFNCEMKTDRFQFGIYEDVTTDHKISQRKLIIGYLLGIIEKNNYQDRNNLCLMRSKKNIGKGCKSFYERTKNTNYNLQDSLGKLNEYLKSDEGQFLLSLRKENGSWANLIIKIALWYKGHQICNTSFYQKNKVEKGSFVIQMIIKHHKNILRGIYIDPHAIG